MNFETYLKVSVAFGVLCVFGEAREIRYAFNGLTYRSRADAIYRKLNIGVFLNGFFWPVVIPGTIISYITAI